MISQVQLLLVHDVIEFEGVLYCEIMVRCSCAVIAYINIDSIRDYSYIHGCSFEASTPKGTT